jgi:transposase
MPKDSNRKRRETTDIERVEVLKLYAEGYTYRKIQAQTGISKSDVSKIIKRYKETGSLNKVPRPGRPRIIDERAIRCLDRITNNNPYTTLAGITADSRLNCAPKTVARALHELDYHLRVPRKKPFLSRETKCKQLLWARERRHWTRADWRMRFFAYECKVEAGLAGSQFKIRRKPGTELENRYLQPSFVGEQTSAMFWGAIGYQKRSPLIYVRKMRSYEYIKRNDRGGMNSVQYCDEVLATGFLPMYREAGGAQNSYSLVEDTSRVHTSGHSRAWKLQAGIVVGDWVSYSPDLNRIENFWRSLKRKLRLRMRDIQRRPHNQTELIKAAQEEWNALNQKMIDRLIDSMPLRIVRVIRAHGGHTRL